ncbi:MAG: hypothetical protein WA919_19565 [Coleofasciculaceae cyanobacterium]
MQELNCSISSCRFCRNYEPQGRRGGVCSQLGVPVKPCWKPCSLAISPFSSSWQDLESIWQSDEKPLQKLNQRKLPVSYSLI